MKQSKIKKSSYAKKRKEVNKNELKKKTESDFKMKINKSHDLLNKFNIRERKQWT